MPTPVPDAELQPRAGRARGPEAFTSPGSFRDSRAVHVFSVPEFLWPHPHMLVGLGTVFQEMCPLRAQIQESLFK